MRSFDVTEKVLHTVFDQLYSQRVLFEGMLLKPNMILPGLKCPEQDSTEHIADLTVKCLLRSVPASVAGITFLSGGQSPQLASARLNAMNVRFKSQMPWPLSFSFARAIQQPALDLWQGNRHNVSAAQDVLLHRAKCNWSARRGDYSSKMDLSELQRKAA